jgi:hypothetical protein
VLCVAAQRIARANLRVGETLSSIIKIAVVGAGVYAVVRWQFIQPQLGEIAEFAEKACVDRIESRFDPERTRVYSVKEDDNGYVVRASLSYSKRSTSKVYCLTNKQGGVREIIIAE